MPFANSQEADRRLTGNSTPLTEQEVRDLLEWMRQISEAGMRRLNVELSLQNLAAVQEFERSSGEAVHKFERSSSRLTWWLIGLTAALVVLTIIIACYTIQLARIGH